MKKKISINAITCWLNGWVSQTDQVENNDNTILDALSIRRTNRTPPEEIKSFKFANFKKKKYSIHHICQLEGLQGVFLGMFFQNTF